MATLTATTDAAAGTQFQSNVQASGLNISRLSEIAQLQLAVAELYINAPPGSIAAGDIASGTFGANIPDTGTYTFPGALKSAGYITAQTGLIAAGEDPSALFAGGGGPSTDTPAIMVRATNAPRLFLGRVNTSFAAPAVVTTGQTFANVALGGWNGASLANGVLFSGIATEPWTETANGSQALIYARPNGSTSAALGLTVHQDRSITQGGLPAQATTTTMWTKTTTGIADATPTAVITVSIPAAAHSAALRIRLVGSLGAGGAVGANEATGSVTYEIAIAKTAGVAAVVTVSTAFGSAMASEAGAATITVTAAASSIAGGTAANSFTVNVTITKGSGSSANHTCVVFAELTNANATGVTLT